MKETKDVDEYHWDKVTEKCFEIVDLSEKSDIATRELLDFLDELIEYYGKIPKLLATYADYVEDTVLSIGNDWRSANLTL